MNTIINMELTKQKMEEEKSHLATKAYLVYAGRVALAGCTPFSVR